MYLAMPIEAKKGASTPDAKASSVLSQSATRACIERLDMASAESEPADRPLPTTSWRQGQGPARLSLKRSLRRTCGRSRAKL